jgi:hypothetical protein
MGGIRESKWKEMRGGGAREHHASQKVSQRELCQGRMEERPIHEPRKP